MLKSRSFWIAVSLFAFIPWLGIDLAEHKIDWDKDVREELIYLVQEVYSFDKSEKAAILDTVFARNQLLISLMFLKGFLVATLLIGSVYFFRQYYQVFKPKLLKPLLVTITLFMIVIAARLYFPNQQTNKNIRVLSTDGDDFTLTQLHRDEFQGKVLYVDFWGTTCGPCLEEFRNFTSPLKEHYRSRKDIAYLYVAQGNKYLWRKQVNKFNVKGDHLFLNEDQYARLYRNACADSTAEIIMPRYLILDKYGVIVEKDAKRPSDKASLIQQLDKHLEIK